MKMREDPYLFSGWHRNPFEFSVYSDFFVGYDQEKARIMAGIRNGEKLCLLMGPTGSGKTTFLKHIQGMLDDSRTILIPKPPRNPQDWLSVFSPIIRKRFTVFRKQEPTLYNLHEIVNDRLDGERLVLFVDECHESSVESLEWLRTFIDQIQNITVVIAALPVFERQLKENLETLMKRVSVEVRLTNLTKSETRELIKRRIERSGGRDIEPFTSDSMQYIYDKTAGFPREVLRLCSEIFVKAAEKKISTIDLDFLQEVGTTTQRMPLNRLSLMPEMQRSILELLGAKGPLTPGEIAKGFEDKEYKSQGNAIRSVNNVLKRLMAEGFVERQRIGKSYQYKASGKVNTVLVNA